MTILGKKSVMKMRRNIETCFWAYTKKEVEGILKIKGLDDGNEIDPDIYRLAQMYVSLPTEDPEKLQQDIEMLSRLFYQTEFIEGKEPYPRQADPKLEGICFESRGNTILIPMTVKKLKRRYHISSPKISLLFADSHEPSGR